MLAELTGTGKALVAGGADVWLAAVAPRAAGGGTAAARLARRARAPGAAGRRGVFGWQCGHSAGELDSAKDMLNATTRAAARDKLQLSRELRGRWRYECLLRGGRALPARLLRGLGAALRAFCWVRWRTGHLALIFNAIALYP